MSTKSVIDILEELEATSGSLAKREILDANVKNDLLKRSFVAAGDPYTVYYVSKFKMPSPNSAMMRPLFSSKNEEGSVVNFDDDDIVDRFVTFITQVLATRQLTGNDAKSAVESMFSSMTELQQKWCQRILLKNMRCGVQTTVNKVWPDAIKTFEVALAETLKSEFVKDEGIKILESVKYPVRVEPKLDGLRCIAVKKNGKVTFFTRNGTELDSMPKIKEALEAAKFDNVVLDGEGMAADWNESASVMMSKTQKDDSNLVYNVFDAMPLTDWADQKCELPYIERCKLVNEVVLACVDFTQNATPRVRQVQHIMAQNECELKAYFARCMDDGYEGVMLKTLDTPYKFKRSKNILKLKPCVTYEGVIVGHYEGRRGTKREGLFGGFEVVLPNGVVTRIGGGFNDALKADIQLNGPDKCIGKIVEIEAQPDPMTKDGLTVDGKARFPVFVRFRDEGDVDSSVIAAGVKWIENGHS
jgi:DNA ligase-1